MTMQTDTHESDSEVLSVERFDSGTEIVGAVDRAQIDMQIATAKAHPRSITKALREARTLATLDPETAASCFYVIKRGDKKIDGPSARLAEIIAYSWGNLRIDADIVGESEKFVTAMGTCFDLEKNVAIRVRVRRRITDSRGRRYNDDMIATTSNAAISIALRNAVFKTVPASLVRNVYSAARSASTGSGTMEQKRRGLLEYYADLDVSEADVLRFLDVRGVDDIGEDELITLRGVATAIRDSETTVTEVFRQFRDESAKTADLNAALEDDDGDDEPDPDPTPPEGEPEESSDGSGDSPDPVGDDVRESIEKADAANEAEDDDPTLLATVQHSESPSELLALLQTNPKPYVEEAIRERLDELAAEDDDEPAGSPEEGLGL